MWLKIIFVGSKERYGDVELGICVFKCDEPLQGGLFWVRRFVLSVTRRLRR